MASILRKILLIDLFKYHKMKIFIFVFLFVAMFMWVFPFSDLSDLVTDQVATQTQGTVFVQFGHLDFNLFPTLSLTGEDVIVDTAGVQNLKIGRLTLWPSIASLLSTAKNPNELPNFSVRASQLFRGDLYASVSSGKGQNKEVPVKRVQVNGNKLDLSDLAASLVLPLKLQGSASLEGDLTVDPNLNIQPEGELTLNGEKVRIPPGNIPTQMGPLFLPGFSWSQLNVKSRLSNGVMYIEQATLGGPQDSLYLQLKGQVAAPIAVQGVMVRSYDLRMDLQISPALAKELGPFLSFIDQFKRSSGNQSRYVFRAVSSSPGAPPNLMPLSNF